MKELEDKSVATTATQTEELTPIRPRYATFIVFAELLGYDSPLVEWAEEWCKKGQIDTLKEKIVKIDAKYLFRKMCEDYTIEEIRKWWECFYEPLLQTYDNTLSLFEDNDNKDDFPF